MSSRSKSSKASKSSYKAKRTFKNEQHEERNSLWEFDEEHDAATVICEVLKEQILLNPGVEMTSFRTLVDATEAELNKSDVVLTISAAILNRIGMTKSCELLLTESDVVFEAYKSMNLENKAVLKMFCNMVCIMCPEFIKSIEFAVIEAMRSNSRRTNAMHTNSRLTTAMNGLVQSGALTQGEASMAALNANIAVANDDLIDGLNSLLITAPSMQRANIEDMRSGKLQFSQSRVSAFSSNLANRNRLIDFVPSSDNNDDDIRPEDSVSRHNSQSKSIPQVSMKSLSEMARRKDSFEDKQDDLYYEYPTSKMPVVAKGNKGKQGLGFAAELESVAKENKRIKMARLRRMSNEKMQEIGSSSGLQATAEEEMVSDADSSVL